MHRDLRRLRPADANHGDANAEACERNSRRNTPSQLTSLRLRLRFASVNQPYTPIILSDLTRNTLGPRTTSWCSTDGWLAADGRAAGRLAVILYDALRLRARCRLELLNAFERLVFSTAEWSA